LGAQHLLGNPAIQPGAFALVGMGAVFAGIVRAPVTSIIIIFEMTDNYSIILPLMIANITSYLLATELSPTPIYDALLLQDGIHLPHEQRHALKQLSVSAAMTAPVTTLAADEKVAEVFARLEGLPEHFHAYPVIEDGRMIGICTFNDLKRALSSGKDGVSLRRIAVKQPETISADESLDAALVKMGKKGISQLPVVDRDDGQTLIGMVTMQDIARKLASQSEPKPGAEEM
jgi:CIC family chloride channel protein